MPWSLFDILLGLPLFALILLRVGALVMAAPVFGSTLIPIRIRAAMAFAIAAMMFPVVRPPGMAEVTLSTALTGAAGEVLIGLTVGLSLTMLLTAAEVTGVLVGQQAGLAAAEVLNPTLDDQVSLGGQLYAIVFTMCFLLIGGHRSAMNALLDTFQVIPLLQFQPGESVLLLLVEMLTGSFVFGLRLAAPVVIALFLTETALGLLSRSVPQINILSVGFIVRMLVALTAAALTFTDGGSVLFQGLSDGLENLRNGMGLNVVPRTGAS